MQINVLQILFQAINFGVVFGAVAFLLYKPILKILDERREKALEAEKNAALIQKEKDELESSKKKSKTQMEKDAAKVLDKAQEDAKKLRTELTAEVRAEIKQLREKEMTKLREEVSGKNSQVRKQVGELSVAIAAKVIGEKISVDSKLSSKLIDEEIKTLESSLASM